jgi:sugar phosphate isomerase/epimerase
VPKLNVGVQLRAFRLPLQKALIAAARIGADGVEIDAREDIRPKDLSGTALRQIRKMLNDLNLRVVSVRFQTRRGYDCLEELDRRVDATKEVLAMAAQLGASTVINQVGIVPNWLPGENEPPSLPVLRDVLSDLGRYSYRIGTFLACETGTEPLENLQRLIESLQEGSAMVALNPGNLIYHGFGMEGLKEIAKHIAVVHVKDAVHDRGRGRGTEVELGRGLVDFPEIIATLEERHFQGSYVIDREQLTDPTNDLATSIQFLRSF